MNNLSEQKEKIIAIVSIFFPKAKVYLFGSYARGTEQHGSDIDIAIDNGEKVDPRTIIKIREMIDIFGFIQHTDVVDFHAVPQELQETILEEGILWKS